MAHLHLNTRFVIPGSFIYFIRIWSWCLHRAASRLVPSQWETALLCNNVSHWLGASLESALPTNIRAADKELISYKTTFRSTKCETGFVGTMLITKLIQLWYKFSSINSKWALFIVTLTQMASGIFINVSSDNGLSPDGINTLREQLLTYKALWHSFQGNVCLNTQHIKPQVELKVDIFWFTAAFARCHCIILHTLH